MRHRWLWAATLGLLLLSTLTTTTLVCAELPEVRIGMVTDMPLAEDRHVLEIFKMEINELLQGEFEAVFSSDKLLEADWTLSVTLRAVEADRQDLGKLETLDIYAQATGKNVSLKQVADLEVVWQPSKILRRDRVKTVTVESFLETGVTAMEIITAVQPWLDDQRQNWPIGYKYEFGGELESSIESQQAIMAKLPLALAVIVLLDRIRIEIDENKLEPGRAVIEAAQKRLRPILLTTATTVGSMLPLVFGGGPMFKSMAIAIISGLIFATLLTLGVVPILYSLFFKVRFKDFKY